ncbi:MAG: hypothetical protein JO266_23020 [Acidobacteria bacterium]|nr:hypothetical protein [Acidobacteriota bacterium]
MKWVYSCDLFDSSTIERLSVLYQIAVEQITAGDDGIKFQETSLQRLKQIEQRATARI